MSALAICHQARQPIAALRHRMMFSEIEPLEFQGLTSSGFYSGFDTSNTMTSGKRDAIQIAVHRGIHVGVV